MSAIFSTLRFRVTLLNIVVFGVALSGFRPSRSSAARPAAWVVACSAARSPALALPGPGAASSNPTEIAAMRALKAAWDPQGSGLSVFENGAFVPYRPEVSQIATVQSSPQWYGGQRGNLPPAHVLAGWKTAGGSA